MKCWWYTVHANVVWSLPWERIPGTHSHPLFAEDSSTWADNILRCANSLTEFVEYFICSIHLGCLCWADIPPTDTHTYDVKLHQGLVTILLLNFAILLLNNELRRYCALYLLSYGFNIYIRHDDGQTPIKLIEQQRHHTVATFPVSSVSKIVLTKVTLFAPYALTVVYSGCC